MTTAAYDALVAIGQQHQPVRLTSKLSMGFAWCRLRKTLVAVVPVQGVSDKQCVKCFVQVAVWDEVA